MGGVTPDSCNKPPTGRIGIARRMAVALMVLSAGWLGLRVAPAHAADAATTRPSLLAHGTEKQLWVADVQEDPTRPPPAFRTVIQSRILGKAWQPWGTLQGRVVALGNRNSDLAVLFDGGQWFLFWRDTGILSSSQGRPLPRPLHGRILTFATDLQTVWAVAEVNEPSPASTTAPATSPSTRQSSPRRYPALFSLQFDQWKWIDHGPLPESLTAMNAANSSLAVVDHRPVIALADSDHTLKIAVYEAHPSTTTTSTRPATTQSATWHFPPPIRSSFPVDAFKVLGDSQRPGPILVWAAPKTGAGVIYTRSSPGWEKPIPLQISDKTGSGDQKTIALAGERLRLVSRDSQTQSIVVHQFDLKGKPLGAQPALQSSDNEFGRIEFYMEVVLMAALVIAVVGTFYRRKQPPKPRTPDRLPLASTGARLGAGLIDLTPVFAGIVVAAAGLDPTSNLTAAEINPHMKWALWGVFAYLFYTTALELIAGRTLGKMLLGLRVVTVEGRKADWSALLMRNILRIVDIWLAWIPLALIFYTPLRQRIGDVAAATVVVTNAPIPEDEQAADPSDSATSDQSPA